MEKHDNCKDCIHNDVCSLKNDYAKTINDIYVGYTNNENVNVTINCKMFKKKATKQDGINWR